VWWDDFGVQTNVTQQADNRQLRTAATKLNGGDNEDILQKNCCE